MSPELLAQAVQEDELRDELVDRLSPEEVAAFDDYVSGYHAREYVIDKKDSKRTRAGEVPGRVLRAGVN